MMGLSGHTFSDVSVLQDIIVPVLTTAGFSRPRAQNLHIGAVDAVEALPNIAPSDPLWRWAIREPVAPMSRGL
jgi:hypothetical protein